MLIEWLAEIKNNVNEHGIRWGLALSLYALFRKERRNFRLDKRDDAIFHNLRVIMEKLEVLDQWHGPVKISRNEEVQSLKRLFSSLQVAINQVYQKRRKKKMLKILTTSGARKVAYFLIVAAITEVNNRLNLNIDSGIIFGMWGAALTLMQLESHFNMKKFISSAINALSGAMQAATTTTDGSPITPVIAPPMTYEETMKVISDVHTDINRIFADAKNKDDAAAMQNAVNVYSTLHDYFAKEVKQ
jgi:hypothetical protein